MSELEKLPVGAEHGVSFYYDEVYRVEKTLPIYVPYVLYQHKTKK